MTTDSVRLLTTDDLAAFRELFIRSLREEPSAFLQDDRDAVSWPPERFSRFMGSNTMGAFIAETLVGFAGLTTYRGQKIQHKGMIGPVYVAPEARGHKFAARMIALLEDIAKKAGIEQITLSTDVTNEITQHIYKKLGYEPWGVEKHILKLADGSYVDDVVMIKFLT